MTVLESSSQSQTGPKGTDRSEERRRNGRNLLLQTLRALHSVLEDWGRICSLGRRKASICYRHSRCPLALSSSREKRYVPIAPPPARRYPCVAKIGAPGPHTNGLGAGPYDHFAQTGLARARRSVRQWALRMRRGPARVTTAPPTQALPSCRSGCGMPRLPSRRAYVVLVCTRLQCTSLTCLPGAAPRESRGCGKRARSPEWAVAESSQEIVRALTRAGLS